MGPPPPGATRELGVLAMLLSLIGIRLVGRLVNTAESGLFTEVRGIEIPGSPRAAWAETEARVAGSR